MGTGALGEGAKVNIDYHVGYDGRIYSVPHALVSERVEVRATNAVVGIFHRARRVASHARLWGPQGSVSTVAEHRPRSHRGVRRLAWMSIASSMPRYCRQTLFATECRWQLFRWLGALDRRLESVLLARAVKSRAI